MLFLSKFLWKYCFWKKMLITYSYIFLAWKREPFLPSCLLTLELFERPQYLYCACFRNAVNTPYIHYVLLHIPSPKICDHKAADFLSVYYSVAWEMGLGVLLWWPPTWSCSKIWISYKLDGSMILQQASILFVWLS